MHITQIKMGLQMVSTLAKLAIKKTKKLDVMFMLIPFG